MVTESHHACHLQMQKRREWNKSIVYEGEQLIGKKLSQNKELVALHRKQTY